MAIKSIDILNVMVFKRREGPDQGFHLRFGDGINVLTGENGVGKTTLLKMIYAATQWSITQTDAGKSKRLLQFFSNYLKDDGELKSFGAEDGFCYYRVSDGAHCFEQNFTLQGILHFDEWLGLNIESVFIPTTEMLSHSKGFLALNQKYHMPFDGTQVDIIVNASLPETREVPENMRGILDKIGDAIDGIVIMEEDSFYVEKKDGRRVEFSLEAEGLRKLGLLWKLIRNGLLESGSILLWDEPEANLNPELYPLAAEILLGLQENGVQIFVATHNYNFAKYLEIRRTRKEQVIFHNLYKENQGVTGNGGICSKSADTLEKSEPNHIIIADNRLLDEVYNL